MRAAGIELGEAFLRAQRCTRAPSRAPCVPARSTGRASRGSSTRSGATCWRQIVEELPDGFDLAAPVPRGLRTGWAPRRGEWPASPRAGNGRARRLLGSSAEPGRSTRRAASSRAPSTAGYFASRAARPHGPPREVAAAVRAAPAEHALRAVGAERALEGADPGEVALGRQVTVAALAVRAKLEHRSKPIRRAARQQGPGAAVPPGPTRCWSTAPFCELEAVRRGVGAHEGERWLHDGSRVGAGGVALGIEARLRRR